MNNEFGSVWLTSRSRPARFCDNPTFSIAPNLFKNSPLGKVYLLSFSPASKDFINGPRYNTQYTQSYLCAFC
jgi:hypothetical protein